MRAAAGPALLQVQGLSFSYPGRHVFTGWSAGFPAGISWVRGSNGSGKSTLLKLLGGALPPLTGSLAVRGIEASAAPLDYRREVFWCGPGAIAFDHLRPPEFFGFMRSLYPRFDVAVVQEQVAGLGLDRFLDRRLNELSTGTQRKAWLAAAWAAGTTAVLLDEPLNALDDASTRHVLAQLVRSAADPGRAWIVASHEALGAAGEQAMQVDLDPRP